MGRRGLFSPNPTDSHLPLDASDCSPSHVKVYTIRNTFNYCWIRFQYYCPFNIDSVRLQLQTLWRSIHHSPSYFQFYHRITRLRLIFVVLLLFFLFFIDDLTYTLFLRLTFYMHYDSIFLHDYEWYNFERTTLRLEGPERFDYSRCTHPHFAALPFYSPKLSVLDSSSLSHRLTNRYSSLYIFLYGNTSSSQFIFDLLWYSILNSPNMKNLNVDSTIRYFPDYDITIQLLHEIDSDLSKIALSTPNLRLTNRHLALSQNVLFFLTGSYHEHLPTIELIEQWVRHPVFASRKVHYAGAFEASEGCWNADLSSVSKLAVTFLTYGDCGMVDYQSIFRWPLGPGVTGNAILRKFSHHSAHIQPLKPMSERTIDINLIATLKNSKPTRVQALYAMRDLCSKYQLNCIEKVAYGWYELSGTVDRWLGFDYFQPWVSSIDAAHYGNSKFTLCPSGTAPDSGRIFDAILSGSIPVVEQWDRQGGGRSPRYGKWFRCLPDDNFSFFRETGAPLIYIDDWRDDLPGLIQELRDPIQLQQRQSNLMAWYQQFRERFRHEWLSLMQAKFSSNVNHSLPRND